MAGKPAGYGSSSGYAVHPGMASYPDEHGYNPTYGSVPGMSSYSNGYSHYSNYDSYPAMDGNSTYPVVDENSTGYSGSSDFKDDYILDAQYGAGSKDPNISPTSFSSPSVNRSAPTHGSLSPAPPGNTENSVHTTTSRSKHTRSAPRPIKGVYFSCLYIGCSYQTKRQHDLERHQLAHDPPPSKFDCLERGCDRTGYNGFDRGDHFKEHMRKVHARDISKLSLKEEAFDCPENGCCRRGTYAFPREYKLKDHLRRMHGKIVPISSIKQEVFDCPEDGCHRTGRRAFARRDNLKDHLGRIHKKIVTRDSIRSREELEAA